MISPKVTMGSRRGPTTVYECEGTRESSRPRLVNPEYPIDSGALRFCPGVRLKDPCDNRSFAGFTVTRENGGGGGSNIRKACRDKYEAMQSPGGSLGFLIPVKMSSSASTFVDLRRTHGGLQPSEPT